MRLLPVRRVSAAALAAGLGALVTAQEKRATPPAAVESVLPALAYGAGCSLEIELRNLSDRAVTVELEGHRESGAVVGLAGYPGNAARLGPHERAAYRLDIAEETSSAWVKVRERAPPGSAPGVAVSAVSDCVSGNELRSVRRDVAFPQNNPWFDSEAAPLAGGVVSMINTAGVSALARVCYSAGNLFSVPTPDMRPGSLVPICSVVFDVQMPPFGAREFPVERAGSTHFTLRTLGRGIVLQMLRPLEENVRIYRVDSTIRFGEEEGGRR